MIEIFNTIILSLGLPFELIIFATILLSKIDFERKDVYKKFIFIVIYLLIFVLEIINYSGNTFSSTSLFVTVSYCIMCYLVTLGYIFYSKKISFFQAVYVTNIAYLLQHFTHSIYLLIVRFFNPSLTGAFEFIIFLFAFALTYYIFGEKLVAGLEESVNSFEELETTIFVIGAAIVLSAIAKNESNNNTLLYFVCNGYAMIFCFYAIWTETQKRQKAVLERKILIGEQLFLKYKEQYEISQENIKLINHKCHDLKHQIAALKQIENSEIRNSQIRELESAVMIYDSMVHTGNEILDTILTEKSLYCEAHGIRMACVADGDAVKSLDPIDLYTIFGNALDNSLECVAKTDVPEKRVISVIVTQKSDMIFFQFENYYEEVKSDETGKFLTTKGNDDYHGFGLSSIKFLAEKYGGFVNIETDNNIFLLRIMIPIQS